MTLSGSVALFASCFRLLLNKHMVRIIMKLVPKQNVILTTCDNKHASLSEKHCLAAIGLGFPAFQLLYVQPALHNFPKSSPMQTI